MTPANVTCYTDFGRSDYTLYDCRQQPFVLHGFYDAYRQPSFKRLPDEVGTAASERVAGLYRCTTGGRLRFATDSDFIILKAVMPALARHNIMPDLAACGFDLYLKKGLSYVYERSFIPALTDVGGFEQLLELPEGSKEILIHFPLNSGVTDLLVGLKNDASVSAPAPYGIQKPVVFYGSSITHGFAASRPGNTYPAMISRMLDCDFVNLGFAGGCRAEDVLVDYIATLDCSAYVLDYDHNAPTADYLGRTHQKAYRTMRAAHPSLPIIIVSRPDVERWGEESIVHREIVYRTYANARAAGDQNVYFIDGEGLFEGPFRDSCTVDAVHPNDLGFMRMANRIGETLSRVLNK